MKHFGLIGRNISHSISNKLHKEIGKLNDLSLLYDHFDVEEEAIEGLVNQLKEGLYDGFNVTVPYKETVLIYVDILMILPNKLARLIRCPTKTVKSLAIIRMPLGFLKH